MKRILVISVLFFLLNSCKTIEKQYTVTHTPEYSKKYYTKVISDPPGARIEANSSYIGKTPCNIEFEYIYSDIIENGKFITSELKGILVDGRPFYVYGQGIIKAYPTKPGQWTQIKTLQYSRKKPPSKLYFDMRLSGAKQYELKIK